jgi:sugar lactone lactonase YvrE
VYYNLYKSFEVMKIIRQLSIVQFMFMGAVAFGQTNLPFQHPRDQIALQLGAIQMGYSVPFQLVGNPTSAQQAANALAMGRNILAATPAKPAVKVQGFVSSPAVDSVEFRDQLYQAVEAVVTTPVIGSIKGSVMLNNGKKQSISATLSLPPITYTIPVPYALESASSLDAQSLATQVDSLSGSVAAVQNQNTALSTEVGSLSGNLTTVQGLTTALSSNVTTLGNQTAAISGNLSSVTNNVTALQSQSSTLTTQVDAISGNMTAVQSQASALSSNVTTLGNQTTALSGNLSSVTSSLTELQNQNAALKQLLMGLDIFTSVSTLAGNGKEGYVDGIGAEAEFYYPDSLAVDGAGNVYVTEMDYDIEGYRIRKITPEGEVTTLESIDGQLEDASYYPSGIAVDAIGNVYVAENGYRWDYIDDQYNEYITCKIRKITPAGAVTTSMEEEYPTSNYGSNNEFLGTALGGVAVDANGAAYFTESIVELDEYGDATWSGGIRKISPSGELSTIVKFVFVGTLPPPPTNVENPNRMAAPAGAVELEVMSFPKEIAVDTNGNIYLTESRSSYNIDYGYDQKTIKVRKIAPAGAVSTLAEYMTTTGDNEYGSAPIAVDANGNVYVSDAASNKIRKITSSGIVTTMAGGRWGSDGAFSDGSGADALFAGPSGIAVDANGNVYVADAGNNRIRKITVLK